MGVAAHISGASPGGARYDPTLSSEERSAPQNGIWLCQNCAKTIDTDEQRYSKDKLLAWKKAAEQRAHEELGKARERLVAMAYNRGDMVDVVAAARKGAWDLIRNWKRRELLVAEPVVLDMALLRTESNQDEHVDLASLESIISSGRDVELQGYGGAGKSITLIQFAEYVFRSLPAIVPVLWDLPFWATQKSSAHEFLSSLEEFAGRASADDLLRLRREGRLLLLLDGWNQIGEEGLSDIIASFNSLIQLDRTLGLVIATRPGRLLPRLISPVTVRVLPLTDEKRDLIFSTWNTPADLVEMVKRDPELSKITRTPLFLTAFVRSSKGLDVGAITRWRLLDGLVSNAEWPQLHLLDESPVNGFHRTYLGHLAANMVETGNSSLSTEAARASLSDTSDRLARQGQVADRNRPDPGAVLKQLSNQHPLLYCARGFANVSFAHEQLQEWFAAFAAEESLRKAEESEQERYLFLQSYIDKPAWEQPLLFTIDKLRVQKVHEKKLCAKLVSWTRAIDPVFAAILLHRAGDDVWELVRPEMQDAVLAWHNAGQTDRGLAVMMASGRPEFADLIWEAIGSEDRNRRLGAFYSLTEFNFASLGSDWKERFSKMSQDAQEDFALTVGIYGGAGGMAACAQIALMDVEIAVRLRVLEALDFLGEHERIRSVLEAASDELWNALARNPHLVQASLPQNLCQRYTRAQLNSLDASPPEWRRPILLSLYSQKAVQGEVLVDELAKIPANTDLWQLNEFIHTVAKEAPAAVAKWLAERLARGAGILDDWQPYLKALPSGEQEALLRDILFSHILLFHVSQHLGALLNARNVEQLVDRLMELASRSANSEAAPDFEAQRECNNIGTILRACDRKLIVYAVGSRSRNITTTAVIGALLDLLATFTDGQQTIHYADDLAPLLRQVVADWLPVVKNARRRRGHLLGVWLF